MILSQPSLNAGFPAVGTFAPSDSSEGSPPAGRFLDGLLACLGEDGPMPDADAGAPIPPARPSPALMAVSPDMPVDPDTAISALCHFQAEHPQACRAELATIHEASVAPEATGAPEATEPPADTTTPAPLPENAPVETPVEMTALAPDSLAESAGQEGGDDVPEGDDGSEAGKPDMEQTEPEPEQRLALGSEGVVPAGPGIAFATVGGSAQSRTAPAPADKPTMGRSARPSREDAAQSAPSSRPAAELSAAKPGAASPASGTEKAAAAPSLPPSGAAPDAATPPSPAPAAMADPSLRAGSPPATALPITAAPVVMTHRADWPQTVVSATLATLTSDGGTMVLEMSPDELGTLRITLTLEGDSASVRIQTETPEAARALNEAERQLAQEFARHGVTLSAHDAQSGRRGDTRSDTGPQSATPSDDNSAPDPVAHLLPQGILNLIA